jgi:C4-dicarboxylate transporter DctM subunit
VLTPIADAYKFDPYHFAMVVTFGVLLGSLTPPVAVLVLITSKIAKVDPNKANKPLIPIFASMVVALILIAFIPIISLLGPLLAGGD